MFKRGHPPAVALFDVDGTIVDSVPYESLAWLVALQRVDPTITRQQVRKQMGKGADHLLPALLPPDLVSQHGKELEQAQGEIFHRDLRQAIRPFPGVRTLFQRLVVAGTTVGLVSSGSRADIAHYTDLARVSDLVDFVVCVDDVEHTKPSPDIFEAALWRLNRMRAREVLAIGDSPYDAVAASQVGISTIGLTCGGAFSREELLEAGCVSVCTRLTELIELFGLKLL